MSIGRAALTGVFWAASLLVVYPYVIYPLILAVLAKVRSHRKHQSTATTTPSVSIIISAFNEEGAIAAKLTNTLELDFPRENLEIIVASDASTDGTDRIVREFSTRDERVRLLRQEERRGKSAALNRAVNEAGGDIVVFSDANAMYEPAAIRELVSGFADERVGYVVGAAHYVDAGGRDAAENEGLYWKLELFLKQLESKFGSVVGGDGAIYAVRRSLFEPLKDDDISDFVNPLQVIAAGYRGLFNPAARCFEEAGDTVGQEFRRKRRIVNRSWRAFRRYGQRLSSRQHTGFLFMLLSHKVIRWYALPLIAFAWSASLLLALHSPFYLWCWILISLTIVVALIGAFAQRKGLRSPRYVSIIHYFYVINTAGFLGIWDEWRGVRHVTWDHIRKAQS
jgi:cellulose synthase/poly-beta-1,6-N-acetylglucosamine synthase-like glycosyltransferase